MSAVTVTATEDSATVTVGLSTYCYWLEDLRELADTLSYWRAEDLGPLADALRVWREEERL